MEKLAFRHDILCIYMEGSHSILLASFEDPIIRTGS